MDVNTQLLLPLWTEARTRFSNQLKNITESDLTKKLGDSPNSAGFLIRHVADVELLFSKNVFGQTDLKVSAKTVIAQRDTGEWTNLSELLAYQQEAFECLEKAILAQTDADWQSSITTKEFGAKTKAEALGRIVSHTAYHAGQLGIVLKYGMV
ncbi:damage-inducible protein DinB [Runella rosea]|uniref:Damage-inducible protein DinB n=1 Tax=Runella rosea TaxID=2259595 RepID=A0A344TGC4_9BACT|nr:DinB family protein [Runella rosea]AXE17695.1 damage-inducible protein DinB [Runella rosea]